MSEQTRSRKQEGLEEALAAAEERAHRAETRHNEAQAELARCEGLQPRIDALRDLVRALEALREQEGECPIFGGAIDPARYERLIETHGAEVAHHDERVPQLRQAVSEAEAEWRAASAEIGEAEARLAKERERQRRAEREERRRALRERARELAESGAEPLRRLYVPWGGRSEDDRRHRRIAVLVFLLMFLLSVWIPLIHLPQPEVPEEPEIPERLAQLVVEREQPEPEPEPEEIVEEEPLEEEPEEVEEEPEEEPEVAETEPEPREEAPEPVTQAEADARERASQTGLLALTDELEDLASASVEDKLGEQADISTEGTESTEVSRDIVTAEATQGSGGIETAQLSRNVGGGGSSVGERETSRVESGLAAQAARAERAAQKEGRRGRTDEEIQIVFDRNKAALYRIYNRALRTDPTLQGKVTLKLTIEPSGLVSACEIVTSQLDADGLERKIVQRVKLFNFGAKDVPPVTITYPIDFLPA